MTNMLRVRILRHKKTSKHSRIELYRFGFFSEVSVGIFLVFTETNTRCAQAVADGGETSTITICRFEDVTMKEEPFYWMSQ